MLRPNRFHYLPLALVLVAGIIVLADHSALHGNSEVERCLMCASYADLDKATVVNSQSVPAQVYAQSVVNEFSRLPLPAGTQLAFLARAPPASV